MFIRRNISMESTFTVVSTHRLSAAKRNLTHHNTSAWTLIEYYPACRPVTSLQSASMPYGAGEYGVKLIASL